MCVCVCVCVRARVCVCYVLGSPCVVIAKVLDCCHEVIVLEFHQYY